MGLPATLAAPGPARAAGHGCETMSRMRTPPRTGLAALALGAALATALAGCGSAAAPAPPTGVDGLVVPTPSPDPDDFTATVDNPWFPLPPGARWRYDDRSVAEAATGPEIEGVATTSLVRTAADGTITRDHFAQDRSGNVWWFGHEGSDDAWQAGADGAEAGLMMPARPRVGDGFRSTPGTVSTVEARDDEVTVPLATYGDTVVLEVAASADGLGGHSDVYARGVGLVRDDATGLVAYDEPR